MLNDMLSTTTAATSSLSLQNILICSFFSILLGIACACIYMYRNIYHKNFVVTLALLPVMVQAVIMLVNGNLGTGVAVLGAFSLIRFRSVPGGAREIGSIFFAMAIGLATSMGYIAFAAIFLALVGAMTILLTTTKFGEQKQEEKSLKITIPENLDYTGLFDDILKKYTRQSQLIQVKTSNMGSLYELRYHIQLKNKNIEKDFIDQIRCRNGNLNITCGRVANGHDEL